MTGVLSVVVAVAGLSLAAASFVERPRYVCYRSFNAEPAMTRTFAEMGVGVRAFGVCNTNAKHGQPYSEYPTVWRGEKDYDWASLDAQVGDILRAAPDDRLICMVDLNTPAWLARRWLYDSFDTITHVAAQPRWFAVTDVWLDDFLDYAEAKWGDRIVAYVLMAGNTTEWFEEEDGRASRPKNAAWRAWCAKRGLRYGKSVPSESDLNEAAFEDFVYDPATEAEKIDYWRFHNELVSSALLHYAARARAKVGTRKELGAFFGYLHVCNDYAAAFGHLDYPRVMASPDIDFLISPTTYVQREMGGGSASMLLTGALRRQGKRFLHEIDCWPHASHTPWPGWKPYWTTPADDLAGNTREAAYAIVNHASFWWFDMWGRHYGDPAVRARVAKLSAVARRFARDASPLEAEVLVVGDPESLYGVRDRNARAKAMCARFVDDINRSGVMWDTCSFDDLATTDLSRVKVLVMPGVFTITPARAELLRRRVLVGGRTAVWFYAPGLSDGKSLDVSRVKTWVGVAFRTPGVSTTRLDGYTAVYTADSADYTPASLRAVFDRAGVHAYTEDCVPVMANARLLAVHTPKGGPRTIRLPRRYAKVVDLLTDETVAENADAFTCTFAEPDTRLFETIP